ncbi:MAG TPA: protein phosphatase 2C domain-containing protein [Pirellulaceae bacterium]|nr:protein phosphatase 2C domain-containing protein [Pirellulaceae bacterium]
MGTWNDGLQYAALTDVGMRRRNNQDSHRVVLAPDEAAWRERGHVFMVADGMGAHAAGELASKLAVDNIPHLYLKHREVNPAVALDQAVRETNAEVHRRGQANPDFHHMGTTTSVLVLLPVGALVAHIGDSRIYRLRGDHLEQLTFDHSLVWEVRREGNVPPGTDLERSLPKNVITRSLGPNPVVEADFEGPFPLEPGDTFLLCSDGLTGQVPDAELAPILKHLPPEEAVQVLVDLANLRGGPDNITVIVARVTGADSSTAQSFMTGARKPAREMHPAVWVAAGVLLLAALSLLIVGLTAVALGAGVAGLITLGVGWLARFQGSDRGVLGGSLLGKGPHTSTPCSTPTDFIKKLDQMTSDLRQAGVEAGLDLSTFDGLCKSASDASKTNQHDQAFRQYARAVSALMREFRRRRRGPGDSSVEL